MLITVLPSQSQKIRQDLITSLHFKARACAQLCTPNVSLFRVALPDCLFVIGNNLQCRNLCLEDVKFKTVCEQMDVSVLLEVSDRTRG